MDTSLSQQLIRLILSGAVLVAVFYVLHYFAATADYTTLTSPRRRGPSMVCTVDLAPREVLRLIVIYAVTSRYDVSDIDVDRGCAIFGSKPTFFDWGFFFPVYVSAEEDGKTRVEVRIVSKLPAFEAIVARRHQRFVSGVAAYLFAAGGAVCEVL